jgi:MFS family permease
MGFAPALAGGVLVWANVGGLTGSVLLGLLAQRYAVRGLVIAALILGAGAVIRFGQGQADLAELSLVAAGVGFFTNAAVVGLYALLAQSFPTALRAGGTGFVIGIGRGGSAAGPIIAGFLFAAGSSLPSVALVMALGSVIAAASLAFLRTRHTQASITA